jgi:hypothetical protein
VVDFIFRESLEYPRYLFVIWRHGGYQRFRPPRIGQSVSLPAEDFYQIVVSEALRPWLARGARPW